MKWFKKMITRWVREDWESAGNAVREEKILAARASTQGPFRSASDNIEGHMGLNITVMPAIGGKIITFRHYDRRKDDSQFRHYVIPDDLDFERELGKMITLESLRQG
jgi:hypothetical protein